MLIMIGASLLIPVFLLLGLHRGHIQQPLGKVLPVSFWHRGSCTCKICGRLSALVVIRDGAKTQCQCLYHQYIAQIRSAFLSLRLQVQLCLNEPATQHDS